MPVRGNPVQLWTGYAHAKPASSDFAGGTHTHFMAYNCWYKAPGMRKELAADTAASASAQVLGASHSKRVEKAASTRPPLTVQPRLQA